MKYLWICLLSFNCFAQEVTNECGQTKDQWFADVSRCLTIIGNEVVESIFDMETKEPELIYNVMTLEELEKQWERM